MALTEVPFQGSSMNPLFKNASGVLVDFFEQPVTSPVAVGEVVLCKVAGEWVCHRVLGVNADGVMFKGDYNTTMEVKKDLLMWGIVRGFTRGEDVFGIEKPVAGRWLCLVQQKQCTSKSYPVKKFYRAMSLSLLLVNKLFSIRKYTHRKS